MNRFLERGTLFSYRRADGKRERVVEEDHVDRYAIHVFEVMVRVIRDAVSAGDFDRLPTTAECTFGVESFDGDFGWPEYDDRHTEGSLWARRSR